MPQPSALRQDTAMATTSGTGGRRKGELELVGVDTSSAPHALLLRGSDGAEFRLALDEATARDLREAARNLTVTDTPRLVEVSDETTIGPREIQALIRSGMSADEVASAHGLDIEKVQRFEYPVLMEREHMAVRARTTELRKPHGQRTLEDVVTQRLSARGDDLASLEWDSWKRADGRWTIEATWLALAAQIGDDQMAAARWVFDPVGRTLVPDDAAARALMDDDSGGAAPAVRGTSRRVGGDPYAADANDELTAVVRATKDDEDEPAEAAWTPIIVDGAAGEDASDEPEPELPVEMSPRRHGASAAAVEEDLFDEDQRVDDEFDGIDEPAEPVSEPEATPTPAAKAKTKRGRASVPSWDEILLGTQGPDKR